MSKNFYVIRDKKTGLYFRGKGANRWGEHYNQATIYRVKGTAEHTVEHIYYSGGEEAEVVPIQIIEASEDVSTIVRCENCKKWDTSIRFFKACACAYWSPSKKEARYTQPDGFCCYGERKDDT